MDATPDRLLEAAVVADKLEAASVHHEQRTGVWSAVAEGMRAAAVLDEPARASWAPLVRQLLGRGDDRA